jgi:hypothetical protein
MCLPIRNFSPDCTLPDAAYLQRCVLCRLGEYAQEIDLPHQQHRERFKGNPTIVPPEVSVPSKGGSGTLRIEVEEVT